ncbi:hypothetical protein SAMN05878503_106144 [Cereibacter ovatus]|uniref:Uncharacterized protein n=1 Tax=Cereibacter ovatus TaxID=439529 RepID=A0A285CT03_9RHOB|nr:hypothetical protein SAMN05878503_106144 [Cereibacter ovatus]
MQIETIPAPAALAAAVHGIILHDMLDALGQHPDLPMELDAVRDALLGAGFGQRSVDALAERAMQEEAALRALCAVVEQGAGRA